MEDLVAEYSPDTVEWKRNLSYIVDRRVSLADLKELEHYAQRVLESDDVQL